LSGSLGGTVKETLNRVSLVARLVKRLWCVLMLVVLAASAHAPIHAQTPDGDTPELETVRIWWAAALYPAGNSDALAVLQTQIREYEEAQGVRVEIRVKREEGTGSLYQTLASANVVAPSVVPELAIMRRADMRRAADARLISPVDLSALGMGDLFGASTALGRYIGEQYGVPYTVRVQHMMYRGDAPPTLDELLERGEPILFPAGETGINSVFLAQYIAAGGRVTAEDGQTPIDPEVLYRVLFFYESALSAGVILPDVPDYALIDSYWAQVQTGQVNAALTDSTLMLGATGSAFDSTVTAAIPTLDGNPIAAVDAWMWVMPRQSDRAYDLMLWLMDADRLAAFTQAAGVLPARADALEAWDTSAENTRGGGYLPFARSLIEGAVIPPIDTLDPVFVAAMQTAFMDVITGENTAAGATAAALEKVNG
jgi:ABC-type glycerol-3-phosphate transport system substrate-binding protein